MPRLLHFKTGHSIMNPLMSIEIDSVRGQWVYEKGEDYVVDLQLSFHLTLFRFWICLGLNLGKIELVKDRFEF